MLAKSASAPREKRNSAMRLALRRGKFKCSPNPRKWFALGNTAGVAFINGSAQRGKLRLVQCFLTSQGPQRRAGQTRTGTAAHVSPKPLPTVLIGMLGGVVVGMTSVGSGSLMIVLLLFVYPM